MPRSRSTFIQSERARRCSPRAFTAPAAWMAPPNSSSFSVSEVYPASGWEMMAKVRRRAMVSGRSLFTNAVMVRFESLAALQVGLGCSSIKGQAKARTAPRRKTSQDRIMV